MITFARFTLAAMAAVSLASLSACATASQASQVPSVREGVRLYALDCGRIEVADIGFFSDSGKPTGKPFTMSDPCFLIRHPLGTFLWDTGMKRTAERAKEGTINEVGREFVDASLTDQLKALSLSPSEITFIGISHMHFDHTGNANLFMSSTWLLNRKELEAVLRVPAPFGTDPTLISGYRTVKVKLLDADEDVFGDGTVRILQTPGHTAGHQSLMVKLEHAGTVILSGDLAHTRENWEKHVVPAFNDNRERTAASIERVETLARETHARFVVQHDPNDVHALPKFPAYLE